MNTTIRKPKEQKRIGRPRQTEGHPIWCAGCGYDWLTRSQARLVACPRCHKQIRNNDSQEKVIN